MSSLRLAVLFGLALGACTSQEDDCARAARTIYYNQCVGRATAWDPVSGREAGSSDAGPADGATASECPSGEELWAAGVTPGDFGLEGNYFSDPVYQPATDSCCYTTRPSWCG